MNIKKKIKSCLYAAMSIIIATGAFAGAAATSQNIVADAENSEKTYKIMCMGDSITDGYINGDNGYRKYLCYYLQQDDISYDMVGAKNNWTNESTYNWNGTEITYDPAHCGYSGYAIKQYNGRSGLYETLFGGENMIQTYDPDIMILQIGTNDLLDARLNAIDNMGDITSQTSALQRLESLVDEIIINMDNTDMLFLASVPDIDAEVRADWLGAYGYLINVDVNNTAELQAKVDEYVDTYNAGVKALVDKKKAEGVNIGFADINSVVDMKAGLYDGVHPNETGYAAMGKLWGDTLKNYIDNAGDITQTTTTTTNTTTTTTTTTELTTSITTTTTTATESTTELTTTSEVTTTTPELTTSESETTTTSTTPETTESTTSTTEATTTTTVTTTNSTTTITTEPDSNLGDANWDNNINMSDYIALRKYLVKAISIYDINAKNCDMDGNGKLNIFDAAILIQMIIDKS